MFYSTIEQIGHFTIIFFTVLGVAVGCEIELLIIDNALRFDPTDINVFVVLFFL